MQKAVSIILLNWNNAYYTIACVTSILKHCDQKNFDIIIADNGSEEASLAAIQLVFPHLIYIKNGKNLGFAEGNNRALAYSIEKGYQYSLLLNNDTLVEEDIVTPLYHHLNSNPSVAAVQPCICFLHNKSLLWNNGSCFNSVLGITYTPGYGSKIKPETKIKEVDWITGCCFLVKNNVLKDVGLFNENFFLYYEDVELSFRIKAAGYKLNYVPSITLYHEAGASGKESKKTKEGTISPIIHYYNVRNRIWFLRKNVTRIFLPTIFLYSLVYYSSVIAYFFIRKRWNKMKQVIKGIKDGLFTRYQTIYPDVK